MPTAPEAPEARPSAPVRLARKAVEPVSTPRRRRTALLAAATGLAATAPFPANVLAVGLLAVLAAEGK